MNPYDATKEFVRLSDIHLTPDAREKIWDRIEREMLSVPVKKSMRRSSIWGSGVAAVAAIAMVVGGLTAYHHMGQPGASTGSHLRSSSWKNIPALGPVHYTQKQFSQIKDLGQRAGIDTVYVLTNDAQGQLDAATVSSNVIKLSYGDVTIYEGNSQHNIEEALRKVENATLMSGNTLTLSSGIPAQWLTLKAGMRKTEVLTLNIGQTYIAMMLSDPSVLSMNDLPSVASAWTVVPSRRMKRPSPFTPPKRDSAYTSIGKLKIGQTFAALQKIYGNPTTKTTAHGQGGPEWIYRKLGMTLYGDPTWQIMVNSPFAGALPSGIHIGSSQQAVQHAYPNASIHHDSYETAFTEESPDKQYQMVIELKNGKVYRMSIEKSMP